MKRTPRKPPSDPPATETAPRCAGRTKRGKPCPSPVKPGESHCFNHDPARDAERRAFGAIRNGDPGTELGDYPGITRRAVKILEDLENGTVVEDEESGEKEFVPRLAPAVANARRNTLKFLAEMVERRDKNTKAAKALEELEVGAGDAAGSAPSSPEELI